MRAFLELVEDDRVYLPEAELPPMEPSLLAALRASGILRDGDPRMVELSPTDLGRTLRKLYGILSRGLTLPSTLDERPVLLGWTGEGATRREIILVARPPRGLAWALRRAYRSLVLVPTSRALTREMRERHGSGALVEVEALEETLFARGGRLFRRQPKASTTRGQARARRGRAARRGGEASSTEPADLPVVGKRRALLGGARRWSEICVCKVDETLVRFDLPGRSVRCTPSDLGMAVSGSRKPTVLWEALLEVCDGHGTFKTTRFGSIAATTKVISRLRARLHELCDLSGPPFHRYSTAMGWRARFRARPDLPGDTGGRGFRQPRMVPLDDKLTRLDDGDDDFSDDGSFGWRNR